MSRSENMSRIGSQDTGPEMTVRRFLHGSGFRYSLHRKDLPGTPDLVLSKYSTVVFVHGCFWHQHPGCSNAVMPKTNRDFWQKKLNRNRERDAAAIRKLESDRWNVFVIWECETKFKEKLEDLATAIRGGLDGP